MERDPRPTLSGSRPSRAASWGGRLGSIPDGHLDGECDGDDDGDTLADEAMEEGYRSSTPTPAGAATGGDRPPLPSVAEDGAGPLPPPPPHPHLGAAGGGGDGRPGAASASTRSSTPPGPPTVPRADPPARWSDFFDAKRRLAAPGRGGEFVVYSAGPPPTSAPVLFCCHGAGYTALSWALMARKLRDTLHVVAYDARGHGETRTDDDGDLSAEAQAADAVAVWAALFPGPPAARPPTVLIGHAMGGMAATRAAASGGFGPSLAGLLLVDVVLWGSGGGGGGGAGAHMVSVAAGRPSSFPSYDAAADFAARSGRCRNPAAVRVSFASMLREETDAAGTRWVWRTPVSDSAPHWEGWYLDLPAALLAIPSSCPKLLIFSHKRPLDRALAVAQAQGRLQVLALGTASGYAIHEDEPGALAGAVLDFVTHFRLVPPPPPPPPPGGGGGGGGGPGSRTSWGGGGGGGGGGGMTAASPLRRRTSDVSGA